MNPTLEVAIGLGGTIAALLLFFSLFRATTVSVNDHECILVASHGKLVRQIKEPGICFLPSRVFPWVSTRVVSLRRDFMHLRDVHVNDSEGTTVIVDLWVEYRIVDPERATYRVEAWAESLKNLVTHAATSILGNRSFQEILCDRSELGALLQKQIASETDRWGIQVECLFVRKVSLLPDVSRRIFESISARLDRARADILEAGHVAVAKLEADTSVRVAALIAEAKGQYPSAIGRALSHINKTPAVLEAYRELHRLSVLRPHRTIAFRGFGEGEVRAVDAAMLAIVPTPAEPTNAAS